ncbi:Unannotated [Lentimonas sp. CC19]|nr:Unannotated [Lentimonas sp. CC19]CAA7070692.1 Unannotated [Lentimonas sp. CC11]
MKCPNNTHIDKQLIELEQMTLPPPATIRMKSMPCAANPSSYYAHSMQSLL